MRDMTAFYATLIVASRYNIRSTTQGARNAETAFSHDKTQRPRFAVGPAGASGPATRQIVSSIRTVPDPSMIGFSSVNTRPTSASVRLLRNGLLLLAEAGLSAKRRQSGTAATANTANINSCVCQDGLIRNDNNPTSSAASPSQNKKTPGASSSSAIRMKPKISQFQVPKVVN